LAQWDVRMRLVALLLLTFSFSAVLRLRAVPLMLTVTVSFWLLSGLRTRYLLQRLRLPFHAGMVHGPGALAAWWSNRLV
jgi:hypothetical protein